jgi:hypothetical protein
VTARQVGPKKKGHANDEGHRHEQQNIAQTEAEEFAGILLVRHGFLYPIGSLSCEEQNAI